MSPGISFSASRNWWRPASASERSATTNSNGGCRGFGRYGGLDALRASAVRESAVGMPSLFHADARWGQDSDPQRLVTDDDPALRDGQPFGVDRAEVVRVRIAGRAERTDAAI